METVRLRTLSTHKVIFFFGVCVCSVIRMLLWVYSAAARAKTGSRGGNEMRDGHAVSRGVTRFVTV